MKALQFRNNSEIVTRELRYLILWFFFGIIFAFIISLHFYFPFLPIKRYEQNLGNYLSHFLIFVIPYFFFLIIRLLLIIIHKLGIIKKNNKPSLIAGVLYFTILFCFFSNIHLNRIMFQKIVDNPFVYNPVSKMDSDYRKVIWERYLEETRLIGCLPRPGPDIMTEQTLHFNSDTTAIVKFNYIEKDNHFIWKYLLNIYDYDSIDTFIFRNDTLFYKYDSILFDIGVLNFENGTLRLEPSSSIFSL